MVAVRLVVLVSVDMVVMLVATAEVLVGKVVGVFDGRCVETNGTFSVRGCSTY